jgi:phytol kinase
MDYGDPLSRTPLDGQESYLMSRLTTSQDLIKTALPKASSVSIDTPLPHWVMAIPGVQAIVDRIGITEFRRRLFHMSPALLPIGLPLIPHSQVWGPILTSVVVASAFVTVIFAVVYASLMTRQNEINWMSAVLGYMVPVVAPLLLLRGHAEFGLMTLQILALGDGSATLGGLTLGGHRLPWNQKKTYTGLFCFAIAGTLASTYSFWGEARPGVSLATAFAICGIASVCAALAESLPIRSNDNLRVGTVALIAGILMSSWLC